MKPADFINKRVKDQYGQHVTVRSITVNSVQVLEVNDYYHTTKLYFQGKSLCTHLSAAQ